MNHKPSRINPVFVEQQRVKRVDLAKAPTTAGGLPGVIERLSVVEAILALHAGEASIT